MAALTCSELISSFSQKTFSRIKWDLGDQQHLVSQYLQKRAKSIPHDSTSCFCAAERRRPSPPPKAGIMHVSKYFSYAIDVNGVIK